MLKYVISLLIAMVMLYTMVFLHVPRLGIANRWKMLLSAVLYFGMPMQAVLILGWRPVWIGLVLSITFIPIGLGLSAMATEMFKSAAPWAQPKNKNHDTNQPSN
jgi:hypothetical protein